MHRTFRMRGGMGDLRMYTSGTEMMHQDYLAQFRVTPGERKRRRPSSLTRGSVAGD